MKDEDGRKGRSLRPLQGISSKAVVSPFERTSTVRKLFYVQYMHIVEKGQIKVAENLGLKLNTGVHNIPTPQPSVSS